jgi:hypothetical protein
MTLVVDCQTGEIRVPRSRVDYKMKTMFGVIDVDALSEEEGEDDA